MLLLKKLDENIFILDGEYLSRKTHIKTVEIDGTIYKNESYEMIANKIKKEDCTETHNYSCNLINIDFNIKTPKSFYAEDISEAIRTKYSDSPYTKILSWYIIEQLNNKYLCYVDKYCNITNFKHLSIPLVYNSMGWGNKFYIEVPILDILKADYNCLEDCLKTQIEQLLLPRSNVWEWQWFGGIIDENYFTRKLTEHELINVLNRLYQKKIILFRQAAKHKTQKNQFIKTVLNKKL